jgi:outer membrane protein assembly factor BamD (BamD/ComL family)
MRRALEIIVEAYDKLGMPDLAADSRRTLAANFPADPEAAAVKKHWWSFR